MALPMFAWSGKASGRLQALRLPGQPLLAERQSFVSRASDALQRSLPGPTNVAAFFPSGWMALAPDAFTYGAQVLALRMTSGSIQGGDSVTSGNFRSTHLNTFYIDGAISADGSVCAGGGGGSGSNNPFPLIVDSSLTFIDRIFYSDYQYPDVGLLPGMT